MKAKTIIILVLVLALIYGVYAYFVKRISDDSTPQNGTTQNTPVYYKDLVRVDSPLPNSKVNNNVVIRGAARGPWYFEASFPVKIVDAEGRILAEGAAHADAPWMTSEYVPFTATLQIGKIQIAEGAPLRIILSKDNPSGLPENDDSTSIGVLYSSAAISE